MQLALVFTIQMHLLQYSTNYSSSSVLSYPPKPGLSFLLGEGPNDG